MDNLDEKEKALDDTIANVPPGSKFASNNYNVLMRGQPVAVARSKNMAIRIANALNDYIPNHCAR